MGVQQRSTVVLRGHLMEVVYHFPTLDTCPDSMPFYVSVLTNTDMLCQPLCNLSYKVPS